MSLVTNKTKSPVLISLVKTKTESAASDQFGDKQNSQLFLISLVTIKTKSAVFISLVKTKTKSAVLDKFGAKQNKVSSC